jgi:hypothetical protein
MLEQSCAIKGIVVRRDKKGIGVRFEDLILKQKHVIFIDCFFLSF